jgi:hypothetical protein
VSGQADDAVGEISPAVVDFVFGDRVSLGGFFAERDHDALMIGPISGGSG